MDKKIQQIIAKNSSMKHGKNWPDEKVLEIVLKQLETLHSDSPLGIEQLLPYSIYKDLSSGERSHIGKCVALLVTQKHLPLKKAMDHETTGATKRYFIQ